MPYFGLTSAFLLSPLLEKVCALLRSECAPCSGRGVRLTPVYLCAMLRFLQVKQKKLKAYHINYKAIFAKWFLQCINNLKITMLVLNLLSNG